jgi:hydroxysqualene synthase
MVTSRGAIDLDAAYASCVRDARRHYENFPVASILVPRAMRHDVAAVYAFARAADDFADEGHRSNAERHRLLEGWQQRLEHAAASDTAGPDPRPGEPANTAAIFRALGASIRAHGLPLALFEDLLSAFRQDVDVTSYEDWPELLDYCRRSANPIGRVVLRIAGYRDPQLDLRSDAMCTALQLTNFWQDLSVDVSRGRSYLPHREVLAHDTKEAALAAAAGRTRALFDIGRPLCDAVRGRLRYQLRATWLGGVRILDRVQRSDLDVIDRRPLLGVLDVPWLIARLLTWSLPSHRARVRGRTPG